MKFKKIHSDFIELNTTITPKRIELIFDEPLSGGMYNLLGSSSELNGVGYNSEDNSSLFVWTPTLVVISIPALFTESGNLVIEEVGENLKVTFNGVEYYNSANVINFKVDYLFQIGYNTVNDRKFNGSMSKIILDAETFDLDVNEFPYLQVNGSNGTIGTISTTNLNGVHYVKQYMRGMTDVRGALKLLASNNDTLSFSDGASNITGDNTFVRTVTNSNGKVFNLDKITGTEILDNTGTVTMTISSSNDETYIDNQIHRAISYEN